MFSNCDHWRQDVDPREHRVREGRKNPKDSKRGRSIRAEQHRCPFSITILLSSMTTPHPTNSLMKPSGSPGQAYCEVKRNMWRDVLIGALIYTLSVALGMGIPRALGF
jgi:hypothetical protein